MRLCLRSDTHVGCVNAPASARNGGERIVVIGHEQLGTLEVNGALQEVTNDGTGSEFHLG